MTHDEYTRRIKDVAQAADAAISEAGKRLTRIRKAIRGNMKKVHERRTRAKRTTKPFLRQQLEREANLIEAVVESIRRAL